MFAVAIITRRLKKGKTYNDFRKAWFHKTGFGTSSKLFTMINAFDPREVIVIGFTETNIDDFQKQLEIDVNERLNNPLNEVIESDNISRKFGLLVAEDDFSASGPIDYQPARVAGQKINFEHFTEDLQQVARMITQASNKRDKLKKEGSTA